MNLRLRKALLLGVLVFFPFLLIAGNGENSTLSPPQEVMEDFPGKPANEKKLNRLTPLEAPVAGARNAVWLVEDEDGEEWFWVRRAGTDNDRLLTPSELAELLRTQAEQRTWIHRFFNVSGTAGLLWVGLGLAGQVIFAGRMVVQWIVSERQGRSVVPVIFWWISLAGATLLLAYFIWRRDVVGILGQSMGWMIYVRNLFLIYRPPAEP